jgi:pimeloyl-ACP methyl ester carboxylesterase
MRFVSATNPSPPLLPLADAKSDPLIIETLQAPHPSGLIREALMLLELPRLMLRFPDLARQPRGSGEPVLVLPGHGAGDVSTAVLQCYLRFLGYRVRGWGKGRNRGDVPDLLPRVLKRLISFARRSEQPVRLIGWSLGGYLAREAARERPDLVQQVITLGTPVVGGPKYTVIARRFHRRGINIDAIEAQIELRNAIALSTPVTAIYSRADAIVAWKACIDERGSNVEHVEVHATHLGLGFSPDVYKIIARRLAQPGCGPVTLAGESLRPRRWRWRRGPR